VNEIRWSPDGKRLACVGRGGIEIVDPASGVKTEVVLPDANVNSLRWSFDG
jgi:hypothetical protein